MATAQLGLETDAFAAELPEAWRRAWVRHSSQVELKVPQIQRPSTVGSKSDCQSRGLWFEPWSGHILSLRFGHDKISVTILTLLLIQEEQLSVTGERMDTKYW